MIRFATEENLNELKALWAKTFGDPQQAIDLYFKEGCQLSDVLVDIEGGRLCAMASMLPLRLACGGQSVEGRYIYAVATDESERGKGRSTRLLEYAHTVMKEQGVAASILVPASEGLFSFYERRGYRRAFRLQRRSVSAAELQKNAVPPHKFSSCGAERYYQLRKIAFAECAPFAEWEEPQLRFAMQLARLYGAEIFHIRTDAGEAAAYGICQQGMVTVKEIATRELNDECVLSILHTHLGGQHYEVYSPDCGKGGTVIDFAMIYPLTQEPLPVFPADAQLPYFNLAMD